MEKNERKHKHRSNSSWFLHHLDPILRSNFSCRSGSTEKPILAVTDRRKARDETSQTITFNEGESVGFNKLLMNLVYLCRYLAQRNLLITIDLVSGS